MLKMLYVAKMVNRFLVDHDGPVDCLRMRMPETKVWFWVYSGRYPQHLPDDNWDFQLHDVIAGSLEVNPKGSKHFLYHSYCV